MLDPKLLKENVDGEAIIWAASRQNHHGHAAKAIVVISDGAPVDDSTLLENGPTFLQDHLKHVVDQLEPTRTLAQLQIGGEGVSPFPLVRQVDTLADVGSALFELLSEVLVRALTPAPKVG